MLLTEVQLAAVCKKSGVQRAPEHITSLLLPCVFKGSSNQQPGHTNTHTHTHTLISSKYNFIRNSTFVMKACVCFQGEAIHTHTHTYTLTHSHNRTLTNTHTR